MKHIRVQSVFKLLLLAFIFRFVIAFIAWHPDVNNHVDWGIRFFEYGAKNFYAPNSNVWSYTWPNQPPGTILTFALIRKLFELVFNVFWIVNVKIPAFPSIIITFFESNLYPALLKLPAILSDLGIAYLIYKILLGWKSKKVALFGAFIFLANPVIWYNSAVWGQTDATVNFLALLAFYLAFRDKPAWAILAFSLSIFTKISLAFFAPIFFILLWKKYSLLKILKSSVPAFIVIIALTLPFVFRGGPISFLYFIYTKKVLVQQLQIITANAFNVWAALTGISEQPQTLMFGPLSYQYWGYLLFSLAYIPLLIKSWKDQSEKSIYWVLAISSFSVWMLLTNMHERYLYPLFPYFAILAANNKKLMPYYWVASGINLLNLYNFWWTPRIEPIVSLLSFGGRIMPRILGIFNLGVYFVLYKKYLLASRKG